MDIDPLVNILLTLLSLYRDCTKKSEEKLHCVWLFIPRVQASIIPHFLRTLALNVSLKPFITVATAAFNNTLHAAAKLPANIPNHMEESPLLLNTSSVSAARLFLSMGAHRNM